MRPLSDDSPANAPILLNLGIRRRPWEHLGVRPGHQYHSLGTRRDSWSYLDVRRCLLGHDLRHALHGRNGIYCTNRGRTISLGIDFRAA